MHTNTLCATVSAISWYLWAIHHLNKGPSRSAFTNTRILRLFDNSQCIQWRRSHQNDIIPFPVMICETLCHIISCPLFSDADTGMYLHAYSQTPSVRRPSMLSRWINSRRNKQAVTNSSHAHTMCIACSNVTIALKNIVTHSSKYKSLNKECEAIA